MILHKIMSFIEYFYHIVGTCYNTRFKLFIEYSHSMFKYDITKDLCRLLNVSTIYWKCFTIITSFIENLYHTLDLLPIHLYRRLFIETSTIKLMIFNGP